MRAPAADSSETGAVSRWITSRSGAFRGTSEAQVTMNSSAAGSRSRSWNGDESMGLKSWRRSRTRTSIVPDAGTLPGSPVAIPCPRHGSHESIVRRPRGPRGDARRRPYPCGRAGRRSIMGK
jgi:hypothetical protein